MTRLFRHALVFAALLAIALPTAVNAATVDECQAAIADIGTAASNATFVGKNAAKEETGLLRTLAGASETLAVGKISDTVKKLSDFRLHAVTLGEDGKLDPADAAVLAQLVDEAILCVNSIGT